MTPSLDQLAVNGSPREAARVVEGTLTIRRGERWAIVDGSQALLGPLVGSEAAVAGDRVAVVITQDGTPFVVHPVAGGGGGTGDVDATASATTLPSGAAASVDVTEPVANLFDFAFGIPAGAPGPAGATGPAGPAGPTSTTYDSNPLGSTISWTRTVLPEGYVLASGQTLTRALYPDAYDVAVAEVAASNSLWSVNAAAQTFTVPDLRDRFLFGAHDLDGTVGDRAGASTHVLTESEMPAHTHAIRTDYDINNGSGDGDALSVGWNAAGNVNEQRAQSKGGGNAHNNMPPYVLIGFIVKVKGVTISGDALVGATGPQGPEGDAGPTGPAGVPGPTGPVSQTPGIFSVDATGATGVPPSAYTKIQCGGRVLADVQNWWNTATHRYTPQEAGYYEFVGVVGWGGGNVPDGTTMFSAIAKNGAVVQRAGFTKSVTNNNDGVLVASSPVYMNGTTDYVELWAYQNSGSSINTSAGSDTRFGGKKCTGGPGIQGPPGGNATATLDVWHAVGAAGEPAFVNSWANVAGKPLKFRKDPFGVVQLTGRVAGGANGSVIFTLPAGYRPPAQTTIMCAASSGDSQVEINTDGTVKAWNVTPGNVTLYVEPELDFDTQTVTSYMVGPPGPAGPAGGNATATLDTWHVIGAAGEPAFQNGWVANTGGGVSAPAFMKDPFGRVLLRGQVSGGTVGSPIFTLPVGYRPPASIISLNPAGGGYGGIRVNSAGGVSLDSPATNAYAMFDNVEFDTGTVTSYMVGPVGPAATEEATRMVGAAGQPTFENGWHAYPSATYAACGFSKDSQGRVRVQGLIEAGPTPQGTIFKLPVGYRPFYVHIFNVQSSAGPTRIDIAANGDISSFITTAGTWLSLAGIDFKGEQ